MSFWRIDPLYHYEMPLCILIIFHDLKSALSETIQFLFIIIIIMAYFSPYTCVFYSGFVVDNIHLRLFIHFGSVNILIGVFKHSYLKWLLGPVQDNSTGNL